MPSIPPNNTSGLYGIDNGATTINNDVVANAISANTITASGNITGGNILTPGQVSAAGNVTGNYFIGDGSLLTNINAGNIAGLYGNANVAAYLPTYTGNIGAGNLTNNTVAITSGLNSSSNTTGALTVAGGAGIGQDLHVGGTIYGTFSGNVSGNLVVPGSNTWVIYNNSGNAGASSDFTFNDATNVLAVNGNITAGNVTTTGNVSAAYVLGNGSQLTGLPAGYSNADVATFLANYGSNTISTTGNITAGVFSGNGSALTALTGANVSGTVANAAYATNAGLAQFVTGNAQSNITTVGTLTSLSVTGNTNLGNIQISAAKTIDMGNNIVGNVAYPIASDDVATKAYVDTEISADYFSITDGVITEGIAKGDTMTIQGTANEVSVVLSVGDTFTIGLPNDVSITGNLTANGNVSGNYILGNGALLTGIAGTYGNANVAAFLAAFGSNVISTTGNITGNYIIGDGSQLTNLPPGNYSNANVANYLPTFTGNVGAGNVILSSNTGQVFVNNITGLAGQPIIIQSDGAEDINLNADTIRVGDNNTDATIATHGAGDLTLRTNLGDANQGNIVIRDGASGNIDIQTNGTGVVNITGSAGLRVTDGISATGNVTAGNVNTAGIVSATGNIVTGAGLYGPLVSVSGNVVGGNAYIAGLVSATGNVTGGNIVTGGVVSATGNVTGNYFIGNGSQLTGIAGTYGNANVSNFLANGFGSNNITTTGTITAGTLSASGNVIGGTGLYGSLLSVSGTVTGGNVSTAGLITATGNITGGNINTAGQVTATGNITGGGITSTGRLSTTGNANISGNLYATNMLTNGIVSASGNIITGAGFYGSLVSVTGNINGGGLLQISNNISATGNISTSGRFIGDGSGISNIGVVLAGNMTGNINGNGFSITNLLTLETTGNISGGNLILAGGIEAVDSLLIIGDIDMDGNIIMNGAAGGGVSGANIDYINGGGYARFAGNVTSQTGYFIAGTPGSGGVRFVNADGTAGQVLATYGNGVTYWSTTASAYGDANVATFLAAYGANTFSSTGNVTAGNVLSNGLVSATGNITGGNITTAGIFTASNTTANLRVANIVFNNQQLQTVGPRDPSVISATVVDPGRIVIGTGYSGNLTPGIDLLSAGRGTRLLVSDNMNLGEIQQRVTGVAVQNYFTATANLTNTNTRVQGGSFNLNLGGGASANTYGQNTPLGAVGAAGTIFIGGGTTGNLTALGNTTVTAASGINGALVVNPGGQLRTGIGSLSSLVGGSNIGNIGNAIGFAASYTAVSQSPFTGNVYAVYHPGSTNDFGFTTANAARQATNYYFLRNDDNVAQNKMGAMRLWHNYRYDHTTTTGAITIDKNNGQTQYLAVTGNITGITLSNFVTTASDGTTTDQEMDTVTLWLRQDATGRTITMPTGANYFYTGGTTTVPTTANSVSKIEFTAIDNGGTTQYLIDISAAYTST